MHKDLPTTYAFEKSRKITVLATVPILLTLTNYCAEYTNNKDTLAVPTAIFMTPKIRTLVPRNHSLQKTNTYRPIFEFQVLLPKLQSRSGGKNSVQGDTVQI